MTAATGKGTAMHLEYVRVVLVGGGRKGRPPSDCLDDKVTAVRKALHTDKTIKDIAGEFGVDAQFLMRFIKRRRLCNMAERRNFIALQRSLKRLDATE